MLDMDLADRNESVLLSVTFGDGDVKLRIDRDGLSQPSFREPPIVELTCVGCDASADLIKRLSDGVDKSVEYRVSKQEGAVKLQITIDYLFDDEHVLVCQEVREQFGEYAQSELIQKCSRLARLYLTKDKELFFTRRDYYTVLANLHSGLMKGVDVSARKAAFFAQSRPEKAVEVIGNLQAYQKALGLLDWEMGQLNKARRQ